MLAMLPFLVVTAAIDPGTDAKFLGWTADGQALVWTSTDVAQSFPKQYYLQKGDEQEPVADPSKLSAADRANLQVMDTADMMGAQPDTDETAMIATVHDARRGDDLRFLIQYKALTKDGRANATLKKKYATLGDAAAFAAWKKAHPLARTAGAKSKQGKATITAKPNDAADDTFVPPAWKRGRDMATWTVGSGAVATLGTTCGKDTASEAIKQDMAATYMPQWSATPYWDPSGHRVAFVLEEAVVKTMRGPDGGHVQYVIVPCGPRVEVVAPAGLEKLTGPVADAVEAAGFTVVNIDAAKAQRTATVVYADAAHAEIAAKLIAALPGGGSVDKLTWKPKADIVVAIGDSAK